MARIVIHDDELFRLFNDRAGPVGKDLLKRGRQVKREARRLVPKDTRALERSIEAYIGRDERSMYVRIGSPLPYARRIELGFRDVDSMGRRYNQAPQPYLRPALAHVFASRR